MIKIPAYCVTWMHHKTQCNQFVGAHLIPILRKRVRSQGGGEINVSRMPGGLAPEQYWHSFDSVDAEWSRLLHENSPDRQHTTDVYTTIDDMAEVIEKELQKLANNGGLNPSSPKVVEAPQVLIDLVKDALGDNEDAPKIALALVAVGITSLDDVVASSMHKLCSAKFIGPASAKQLKDKANEIEAKNLTQDALNEQGGLVPGMKIADDGAFHDLDSVKPSEKLLKGPGVPTELNRGVASRELRDNEAIAAGSLNL